MVDIQAKPVVSTTAPVAPIEEIPHIHLNETHTLQKDAIPRGKWDKPHASHAFKAQHIITKDHHVIKPISKSALEVKDEIDHVISAMQTLRKLNHANAGKIVAVLQDKDNYYFVSEYYSGPKLSDKIASEKEAAGIIKNLFDVVQYLHDNGMIHRNIKSGHIVYENDAPDAKIKLVGFDQATTISSEKKFYDFGTIYYAAPEVIKKQPYTEKVDIWSCGVILYLMLFGVPPFDAKEHDDIAKKIIEGKVVFPEDKPESPISKEAKDFILKLLEVDQEKRYSAKQALADPWIKKFTS